MPREVRFGEGAETGTPVACPPQSVISAQNRFNVSTLHPFNDCESFLPRRAKFSEGMGSGQK
jgi:hypothetical protein